MPQLLPQSADLFAALSHLGRNALTVVLFLIGTGITRAALRKVGLRPLIQSLTL
jgi:hypothetical protein